MSSIRIGIIGYGNLGRGVEMSAKQNTDLQVEAIFTRREPETIQAGVKVEHFSAINQYNGKIDVMLLCGGSATDLPEQGPMVAEMFNTVDSFDTHAKIPEYFSKIDKAAKSGGNLSVISTGWDPGLFSLLRLLGESVLPVGEEYTFWGKGVSQGHSDAIRRIEGVKKAVQYTVPIEQALEKVRSGQKPQLSTRDKHLRVCYVVPEGNADLKFIEDTIKTMPNYFADYNTEVNYISEDEFERDHSKMPHGGVVIRTGKTGIDSLQKIEFSLSLGSNPQFTAGVMTAYARAVARLSSEGQKGARTVFDIPFAYLSPKSSEDLRKNLL